MMTTWFRIVPVNFVPAAAVIRRGQALFDKTGRKGLLDGLKKVNFQISW